MPISQDGDEACDDSICSKSNGSPSSMYCDMVPNTLVAEL